MVGFAMLLAFSLGNAQNSLIFHSGFEHGEYASKIEFLRPEINVVIRTFEGGRQVAFVKLNGAPMEAGMQVGTVGAYGLSVDLNPGENMLQAVMTMTNGMSFSAERSVFFDTAPSVTLITPIDQATFGPVNRSLTTPGDALNLTGTVDHLGKSGSRRSGLVFEAKYKMYSETFPGFWRFH